MRRPTPKSWFREAFQRARFCGLAFVDHNNWTIIQCNAAFAALLEYDCAELAGMSIQKITHDDDAGRYREALNAVLAGEQAEIDMTKRYLTRSGRAVRCRAVTTPLWFNNEVACMIKQVAPIVDPVGMEERSVLRETVVRLQAQLELVEGNMKAMMSKPEHPAQINVGGARVNAGNTDQSTHNSADMIKAVCGVIVFLLFVVAYLIYISGWSWHGGDAKPLEVPATKGTTDGQAH